jgi:hypothetical protein
VDFDEQQARRAATVANLAQGQTLRRTQRIHLKWTAKMNMQRMCFHAILLNHAVSFSSFLCVSTCLCGPPQPTGKAKKQRGQQGQHSRAGEEGQRTRTLTRAPFDCVHQPPPLRACPPAHPAWPTRLPDSTNLATAASTSPAAATPTTSTCTHRSSAVWRHVSGRAHRIVCRCEQIGGA